MSIIKKDNLGREIYINVNNIERFIIKYYENTNKKKMIIKLLNNEKIMALYTREGRSIFVSNNYDFIDLDFVQVYKNEIKIKLPDRIMNEYLSILKILKTKRKTYEPRPSRRNTRAN